MEQTKLHTEERKGQATQGNSTRRTGMTGLFARWGRAGPIREIKIHVYAKRQTSDSSWEFLRIENKQVKTVQIIHASHASCAAGIRLDFH